VSTYNESDIAPQTIAKLLDEDFDVHVLDNWSTDNTFESLHRLANRGSNLVLERFPKEGPSRYHVWDAMLRKKEQIATQYPHRWIVHQDCDEVRCSPWEDVSFRGGLYIADWMGFTAIDFTVCNFRPLDDHFASGVDPESYFRYFEFGSRPGHFLQIKAWRQGAERIDLASSGGHHAQFTCERVFPYKFILKHYPLRSSEQAKRKIFSERLPRFHPELRKRGWHSQYDHLKPNDRFLWNKAELIKFDERSTRCLFMTELIAGIGIVR
jgi:hypothetical protein